MDKKNKNIFFIVSVSAAVLIAGVMFYFLLFDNNGSNIMKNNDIDLNNPAYVAEMNNGNDNVIKEEDIEKGEAVDSKINEHLTAKIKEKALGLENVKVSNVKIYKAQSLPQKAAPDSLNQESIYNNIDNQSNNNNNNNYEVAENNSNNNIPVTNDIDVDNVNVIIDLKLHPNSNDMETIRQDMETKANNLAVAIANEKPNIMNAIVNFSLDNITNARASFTFERSGNNMFLQEFTMSSEFN